LIFKKSEEMFEPEVYVQRRKILIERLKQGVILFLGNDESPMNYPDNPYPFRQHSSFLYYFGIDRPSLAALIDLEAGTETVFGDDPSIDELIWTGPLPSLRSLCEKTGITDCLPMVKLYTTLREAQAAGRPIHFLSPYRPENKIKLLRLLNIRPDQFTIKSSEELVKAVVYQRERKSDLEIAEMEKAIDWTSEIHREITRTLRPGMIEKQVVAKVNEMICSYGGQPSFPIIASVHGEILHNYSKKEVLKEGQMLLLDCGAETPLHYAGDLSTTIPVSKRFSSIQKEIYQIVFNAQQAAVSMLAPSVLYREAHFAACRTIFEGLKELGLTKGDTEEALTEGAHALFFPCGTGHMIGLDVHDMEDLGELNVGYSGESKSAQFGLKSLRLAKALHPGFTVTVEPGIYFNPFLIDLWKADDKLSQFINYSEVEKFRDFGGIRNEEDYLITSNGHRLLGKPKPSTISEIESLRQG
jgi:Xaa-Pro aminopeptidase